MGREIAALHAQARRLKAASRFVARAKRLPALWFFTDPVRTPDPVATAKRLPRGAGVVFRAFGAAHAETTGAALARTCRRRGLTLLVGADATLARRLRADGVHMPERRADEVKLLKRRRPGWIFTAAWHGARPCLQADGLFLSPVFPSNSPSAAAPLGPRRAARLAMRAPCPVYALGGVTVKRARTLRAGALAGVAAIEGLLRT
jgi:thiamine-phosphate pyrophosphorylase